MATAKKTVAKKVVAKKAPAKKVVAKKAPAKKAVASKAPAKKVVAKKAPAKKVVAKKAPAKKQFGSQKSKQNSGDAGMHLRFFLTFPLLNDAIEFFRTRLCAPTLKQAYADSPLNSNA